MESGHSWTWKEDEKYGSLNTRHLGSNPAFATNRPVIQGAATLEPLSHRSSGSVNKKNHLVEAWGVLKEGEQNKPGPQLDVWDSLHFLSVTAGRYCLRLLFNQ